MPIIILIGLASLNLVGASVIPGCYNAECTCGPNWPSGKEWCSDESSQRFGGGPDVYCHQSKQNCEGSCSGIYCTNYGGDVGPTTTTTTTTVSEGGEWDCHQSQCGCGPAFNEAWCDDTDTSHLINADPNNWCRQSQSQCAGCGGGLVCEYGSSSTTTTTTTVTEEPTTTTTTTTTVTEEPTTTTTTTTTVTEAPTTTTTTTTTVTDQPTTTTTTTTTVTEAPTTTTTTTTTVTDQPTTTTTTTTTVTGQPTTTTTTTTTVTEAPTTTTTTTTTVTDQPTTTTTTTTTVTGQPTTTTTTTTTVTGQPTTTTTTTTTVTEAPTTTTTTTTTVTDQPTTTTTTTTTVTGQPTTTTTTTTTVTDQPTTTTTTTTTVTEAPTTTTTTTTTVTDQPTTTTTTTTTVTGQPTTTTTTTTTVTEAPTTTTTTTTTVTDQPTTTTTTTTTVTEAPTTTTTTTTTVTDQPTTTTTTTTTVTGQPTTTTTTTTTVTEAPTTTTTTTTTVTDQPTTTTTTTTTVTGQPTTTTTTTTTVTGQPTTTTTTTTTVTDQPTTTTTTTTTVTGQPTTTTTTTTTVTEAPTTTTTTTTTVTEAPTTTTTTTTTVTEAPTTTTTTTTTVTDQPTTTTTTTTTVTGQPTTTTTTTTTVTEAPTTTTTTTTTVTDQPTTTTTTTTTVTGQPTTTTTTTTTVTEAPTTTTTTTTTVTDQPTTTTTTTTTVTGQPTTTTTTTTTVTDQPTTTTTTTIPVTTSTSTTTIQVIVGAPILTTPPPPPVGEEIPIEEKFCMARYASNSDLNSDSKFIVGMQWKGNCGQGPLEVPTSIENDQVEVEKFKQEGIVVGIREGESCVAECKGPLFAPVVGKSDGSTQVCIPNTGDGDYQVYLYPTNLECESRFCIPEIPILDTTKILPEFVSLSNTEWDGACDSQLEDKQTCSVKCKDSFASSQFYHLAPFPQAHLIENDPRQSGESVLDFVYRIQAESIDLAATISDMSTGRTSVCDPFDTTNNGKMYPSAMCIKVMCIARLALPGQAIPQGLRFKPSGTPGQCNPGYEFPGRQVLKGVEYGSKCLTECAPGFIPQPSSDSDSDQNSGETSECTTPGEILLPQQLIQPSLTCLSPGCGSIPEPLNNMEYVLGASNLGDDNVLPCQAGNGFEDNKVCILKCQQGYYLPLDAIPEIISADTETNSVQADTVTIQDSQAYYEIKCNGNTQSQKVFSEKSVLTQQGFLITSQLSMVGCMQKRCKCLTRNGVTSAPAAVGINCPENGFIKCSGCESTTDQEAFDSNDDTIPFDDPDLSEKQVGCRKPQMLLPIDAEEALRCSLEGNDAVCCNNGQISDGFGEKKCICDAGYDGTTCQLQGNLGYIARVSNEDPDDYIWSSSCRWPNRECGYGRRFPSLSCVITIDGASQSAHVELEQCEKILQDPRDYSDDVRKRGKWWNTTTDGYPVYTNFQRCDPYVSTAPISCDYCEVEPTITEHVSPDFVGCKGSEEDGGAKICAFECEKEYKPIGNFTCVSGQWQAVSKCISDSETNNIPLEKIITENKITLTFSLDFSLVEQTLVDGGFSQEIKQCVGYTIQSAYKDMMIEFFKVEKDQYSMDCVSDSQGNDIILCGETCVDPPIRCECDSLSRKLFELDVGSRLSRLTKDKIGTTGLSNLNQDSLRSGQQRQYQNLNDNLSLPRYLQSESSQRLITITFTITTNTTNEGNTLAETIRLALESLATGIEYNFQTDEKGAAAAQNQQDLPKSPTLLQLVRQRRNLATFAKNEIIIPTMTSFVSSLITNIEKTAVENFGTDSTIDTSVISEDNIVMDEPKLSVNHRVETIMVTPDGQEVQQSMTTDQLITQTNTTTNVTNDSDPDDSDSEPRLGYGAKTQTGEQSSGSTLLVVFSLCSILGIWGILFFKKSHRGSKTSNTNSLDKGSLKANNGNINIDGFEIENSQDLVPLPDITQYNMSMNEKNIQNLAIADVKDDSFQESINISKPMDNKLHQIRAQSQSQQGSKFSASHTDRDTILKSRATFKGHDSTSITINDLSLCRKSNMQNQIRGRALTLSQSSKFSESVSHVDNNINGRDTILKSRATTKGDSINNTVTLSLKSVKIARAKAKRKTLVKKRSTDAQQITDSDEISNNDINIKTDISDALSRSSLRKVVKVNKIISSIAAKSQSRKTLKKTKSKTSLEKSRSRDSETFKSAVSSAASQAGEIDTVD